MREGEEREKGGEDKEGSEERKKRSKGREEVGEGERARVDKQSHLLIAALPGGPSRVCWVSFDTDICGTA